MLAHQRVIAQNLVTAQHQLAKIDHTLALALVFVQLVNLGLFAAFGVAHRHVLRAHALFLATANEPLHLLGRKLFIVDVELLVEPLDGRKLVLHIQNLERLRQVRRLVMRPQKAVAQPVEGTDPHAAHVQRQHGRQARRHFLGGLVGEGNGHDAGGGHALLRQQPGNAGGEHARFARARARQNQRVRIGQRHRLALFGVQPLEQVLTRCGRGKGMVIKIKARHGNPVTARASRPRHARRHRVRPEWPACAPARPGCADSG